MNKKIILLMLNLLHVFVIIFPFSSFFTNEKLILKLIWLTLIIIYIGWFLFDSKCFLSEIEKKYIKEIYNEKEDKMKSYDSNIINFYFSKTFNISGQLVSNFISSFYWVSLYLIIYTVSNKLEMKNRGILLILYSVIVYNFKEQII